MQLLTQKQQQHIISKTTNMSKFLKNPLFTIIFFQTLGTLILAFGISVTEYEHPISRKIINPFWTFLISCFNFLAISISGPFTGGHVNPSVTLSMYIGKFIDIKKLGVYFCSQIIGALLGTSIYYLFFSETPQVYQTTPQFKQVLLDGIGDMIGTFIFVFGVILASTRNYMKGQPFKYFYICLMLLIGRTFTFRKGCLNPAIVLAFQIFTSFVNQNFALFYCSFGVIIGSFIGGILAVLFYNKLYDPLLTELEKQQ